MDVAHVAKPAPFQFNPLAAEFIPAIQYWEENDCPLELADCINTSPTTVAVCEVQEEAEETPGNIAPFTPLVPESIASLMTVSELLPPVH